MLKKINKEDHEDLQVYLQILMKQMIDWTITQCKSGDNLFEKFMSYPYFKLVNDTSSELLAIDFDEYKNSAKK